MTSDVSALSSIVANNHQTLHLVSPTPSKIPYGGFSPVRLQTRLTPRPHLRLCRPPSGLCIIPSGETCSLAAEGPHFTLPIRSPRAAACTPVIPESALDDIFLPDIGLRHVLSGSAITLFHVFRIAWVVLRSFCGVRFALRPNGVACPAPARTFTTELAWMGSPLSSTSVMTRWAIVIHHHRTSTGWIVSIMGCESTEHEHEHVRRVDELFSLADQLETRLAKAKQYVDGLKRAGKCDRC
jgi:hypothetical protein